MIGSSSKKGIEVIAPAQVAPTPSIEEVHTEAGDIAFSATFSFQSIVTDLHDANARYDDVEMRATAEIERLTKLRDEATAARKQNVHIIENIEALIGEAPLTLF